MSENWYDKMERKKKEAQHRFAIICPEKYISGVMYVKKMVTKNEYIELRNKYGDSVKPI